MNEWLLVFGVILVSILLPPKYDPAILLKEWMVRKGWGK